MVQDLQGARGETPKPVRTQRGVSEQRVRQEGMWKTFKLVFKNYLFT